MISQLPKVNTSTLMPTVKEPRKIGDRVMTDQNHSRYTGEELKYILVELENMSNVISKCAKILCPEALGQIDPSLLPSLVENEVSRNKLLDSRIEKLKQTTYSMEEIDEALLFLIEDSNLKNKKSVLYKKLWQKIKSALTKPH